MMTLVVLITCVWSTTQATSTNKECLKLTDVIIPEVYVKNIIINLFPLTHKNNSFNLPMISKEIAYRKDFLKSHYVNDTIYVTIDYCSNLSVLMHYILDLYSTLALEAA